MFRNAMKDRFSPGTDLTAITTAKVVGKTFANYSGSLVHGNIAIATAEPGSATAGVIKYDADKTELVGIARGSSRIVTVTAGANLTAGQAVQVGDNGQAIPATTGITVGWCVDDATTGTDALISLAH